VELPAEHPPTRHLQRSELGGLARREGASERRAARDSALWGWWQEARRSLGPRLRSLTKNTRQVVEALEHLKERSVTEPERRDGE
jgi:hypothetical protein